ncbi:phage tail tape measure protein [Campylobacter sp. RM9328]|uniref:phage tail tape measure protein n=1 Tax=Campylobacter sp. RM9328 TaxID=1705720 RepID=UPI001473F8F2|nr:phage tail tape measure protein [Campylobacter sp. RM9328]
MQEESIGISIGLAVRGLSKIEILRKSFTNATNGIKETYDAIKKLDSVKLDTLRQNIRANLKDTLGELATVNNALASGIFGTTVKFAIDDEAAFANVKKYVDDSKENLLALKNEMRKASSELGESFANIANIASGGGKINLKGKELVEYTKLLATGSVAFEMSAEELSRASNNMKVGFKIDDINKMTQLFDAVNLLDNKVTNANASDIFTASSLTAANANLIGLNEKAASAIAATMLSTGKASSVVGTSLNALYSGLSMADKKGENFQKALNTIGLDANYLKTALQKDAAGAITLFIERISKAPKQMQAGLLYDLVGGNFSDELAGLVTNVDDLKKNMALAFSDEATGSLKKELQAKLDTTKSGIERLTQSWRNLGSIMGEVFLPLANTLANALSRLGNFITDMSIKFPSLTTGVSYAVAGFMIFKPLLLLTKIAALAAADGFISMAKVLSWLNPLTVVAKTRSLAHALALKYQAFSTWLVGARLRAAITLSAAWTAATKTASAVSLGFSRALGFLHTGFLRAVKGIGMMKLALISTGIGALVVGIGMAASWLIENWDKVKAFFSSIWESVKPYWQATTQFFSDIWQGLSEFLSGIFAPVIDTWNNIFGGFFDWIGEKFAWVSDLISSIGDSIGKATSWAGEKLGIGDGKESNWYNPLSWFNDDTAKPGEKAPGLSDAFDTTSPSVAKSAAAMTTSGATININFSGGINIATSNGKFDMAEFERQLVSSVKRALKTDEMNAKNRDIRGQ